MTERLPRVVLGVRKATPPDEELKIIVFSPSFVLHLINDVLWLVPLGHLKYVHNARITADFAPVELSPTHCPHTDVDVSLNSFFHSSSSFCTGMIFFVLEKQKSSQIFIVTRQGGNRNTLSGKVACLCACEDRGASPTLKHLSISKSYQLSYTDSPQSTVG